MSRRTVVITAFCALMLALPLGAAWSGKGEYEPSMKRDTLDGWMWPTGDTSPDQTVEKVYLNGFISQCGQVCTQVNPNVAVLRTAVFTADVNFKALFGVWKDCNGDGAIGFADQGLFEYRSELLFGATTICPKVGTPSPIPANWFPSHNDGEWVREFIPISWYNTLSVVACSTCAVGNNDKNPYNINDNGARVWADYGLPESAYTPSCPLIPVEAGTYGSTGGLLHEYDCREGYTVTDTFNKVATGPLAPYSFADNPRDQAHSNSKANVKNPWGQPTDGSYVQAWDCSKAQLANQPLGTDPVYGDFWYANVSAPKVPPTVSTASNNSASGTANALGSGFDECHTSPIDPHDAPSCTPVYNTGGYHDHPGAIAANAPYIEECPVASTPTKVQADDNLIPPGDSTRPAAQTSKVLGNGQPPLPADELTGADGVWSANTQWTNPFFLQRYTLQTGPVPHTFYGYTTPGLYGMTTPKGATGVYGQEACGTVTGYNPATNWQCDRTKWYINSLGNDFDRRDSRLGPDPTPPPGTACVSGVDTTGCMRIGARVGDPYNVRDIDCYDQSTQTLRGAGIGYGVATGQKCDVA